MPSSKSSLENPRRVPYPQWGGSAQYAARLVPMLPPHETYIEPFCGAAALFFAKPPVPREILADMNADIVFALRYIQQFNASKLQALRRYPWAVSHAGQRLAQQTKPHSGSERMWRHIYCRASTWGAKPTCRGFASINDGDVYNLEEMWRFKSRLRNARIIHQDWKRTLVQYDSPGSLFFIDPPYVEEWNISDGVAPEEVAEHVATLKGHYLIAYTDSARARRAFAHSGHQFKLTIQETKRVGAFKKSTRLFVRSWDESDVWLSPKQVADELLRILGRVKDGD